MKILNIDDDLGNWLYAEVTHISMEFRPQYFPPETPAPKGSLSLTDKPKLTGYIKISYHTVSGTKDVWTQNTRPLPKDVCIQRMLDIRAAFEAGLPYISPEHRNLPRP